MTSNKLCIDDANKFRRAPTARVVNQRNPPRGRSHDKGPVTAGLSHFHVHPIADDAGAFPRPLDEAESMCLPSLAAGGLPLLLPIKTLGTHRFALAYSLLLEAKPCKQSRMVSSQSGMRGSSTPTHSSSRWSNDRILSVHRPKDRYVTTSSSLPTYGTYRTQCVFTKELRFRSTRPNGLPAKSLRGATIVYLEQLCID